MYDEINVGAVITSVRRGQERGVKNAIRGAGSAGKYDLNAACALHRTIYNASLSIKMDPSLLVHEETP